MGLDRARSLEADPVGDSMAEGPGDVHSGRCFFFLLLLGANLAVCSWRSLSRRSSIDDLLLLFLPMLTLSLEKPEP